MEQDLITGYLQQGTLGLVSATLIVFLIILFRSKEKLESEYRNMQREDISVMKDLTNIINVMNTSISKYPTEIKEKVSSDIQSRLFSIDNKLEIILNRSGQG